MSQAGVSQNQVGRTISWLGITSLIVSAVAGTVFLALDQRAENRQTVPDTQQLDPGQSRASSTAAPELDYFLIAGSGLSAEAVAAQLDKLPLAVSRPRSVYAALMDAMRSADPFQLGSLQTGLNAEGFTLSTPYQDLVDSPYQFLIKEMDDQPANCGLGCE